MLAGTAHDENLAAESGPRKRLDPYISATAPSVEDALSGGYGSNRPLRRSCTIVRVLAGSMLTVVVR
jgi:hypothetical protein